MAYAVRRGKFLVWLAAAAGACSDGEFGGVGAGDPEGPGHGDPDGTSWSLEIDTSSLVPFVEGFPETASVVGTVRASLGLERVEIGGSATPTDGGGAFEATVPVAAGVQLVKIQAFDADGHERSGDRALLSARYLREGEVNPGAAAMTLTDEVLDAMVAPFQEEVSSLDLREQIMEQAGVIDQQGCTIELDSVDHGAPSLDLGIDPSGQLLVTFAIPDLFVTFHGRCDSFFGTTTFEGEMATDIVVRTFLTAPPSEDCLATLDHSYPVVELPGFDLSIRSDDGGLVGMLVPLVGEIMQGSASEQMSEQIAAQADQIIGEQVSSLTGFDSEQTMSFGGVDVVFGFCLTGLESADGSLRARVGLSAMGPGGGPDGPGAPQVDGDLGPIVPESLWFDANLIGQMMFSLWHAGGFEAEDTGQVTIGLLGMLVPELAERYSGDTPVTVAVSALLPPLVHAAPPESGDLLVEIGDLMIELSVEGQLLFRIGALLRLTIDLAADGGTLMPAIVDAQATAAVLAEPLFDVEDSLLAAAVSSQVGGQAQALLGDTGFELPELGVPMTPVDAQAEPGGRYVRVTLAMGE